MKEIMSPKAICVLGTHRSGTSAITRGLNLLGVYLGEEKNIMKSLPENPEGFWERYDIYSLQERLLRILNIDWTTTSPLRENWHKSDEIRLLKDELATLIKNEFSGRPLWLWKDPRSCLLMPLWREVLTELDIELKVVFVVRNPLDVARSLEKRNGFTIDKGLGVWFNYTISAMKDVRGLETIYLSYDRFLDDPETELKICADWLGIERPVDESWLPSKLACFLRPDLRHSVSGLADLNATMAPEPVIRLYGVLLGILSGELDSNAAASEADVMYREFQSYARFFDFDMANLADCRSLLEKKSTSPEALPVFAELKRELDTRTRWAWKLDSELKGLREQVASTKKYDYDHSVTIDNSHQEVLGSMSSKIAKTLRAVREFLVRLRK